MSEWVQKPSAGTSRWISREFSELIRKLPADGDHLGGKTPDFDVLIVGSGYGASIAAAELAGCTSDGRPLNIAMLERGLEYLPGAFPSTMAQLPTHIRGSAAGLSRGGEGLFDIRGGADVSVILANGLGGGSLINAGVMEVPDASVFDQRWPAALRDAAEREKYYATAKRLLGATVNGTDNTISRHSGVPKSGLQKTQALKLLEKRSSDSGDSGNFREAAITVAMSAQQTSGGVRLNACKLCGDCATGCNQGAKESLDTNLLASAFVAGAKIYCGATVLRIEPGDPDGWRVLVTHTDVPRRLAEGAARWISTRKLILAAGALGSSEILLRSQRHCPEKLPFSTQLGKRFSANGDNLTVGYDHGDANAVADEEVHPVARMVGPTITGIVDATIKARAPQPSRKMVIEELAVPGPLRRIFEESVTFADTLESLVSVDDSDHRQGHPDDDPYAVNARKIRRTSLFASMGDDGAAGVLRLVDAAGSNDGDGFLAVDWPEAKRHPLFAAQTQQISGFSSQAKRDGRTIANPLLNLVPAPLKSFIGDAAGPVLTVHPLGGCAMADSVDHGVVDSLGQVFRRDGTIFPGLVVLDGSIIPSALGTNPALTIAAMSLRAIREHKAAWNFAEPAKKAAPVELGPASNAGRPGDAVAGVHKGTGQDAGGIPGAFVRRPVVQQCSRQCG
ncbi:MAG: GMC family oxidoreductase [Nevskiaceae bacterium]|nr:MAG: GMC family oxidoreductase [Nevskiaceae bacterium]